MRLHTLKRCLRPTLAAICRHVSWTTPFEPVFPHKETLAKLVGASVSSIHNHLKALSTLGLITLLPQRRNPDTGEFGGSKIQLTQQAAELLELGEFAVDHFSDQPSTVSGAGHIKGLTPPVFKPKEDQRGPAEKKPETPKGNPGQQIELPLALADACAEFGIKPAGMAAMRGEARKAGHDLRNIIECARAYMLKLALQHGRAVGYLRKMIGQNVDYAGKAEQAARVNAAAALQAQNAARAAQNIGKSFGGPDGSVYRVLPDAVEVRDQRGAIRRITEDGLSEVYAMIEAGDLLRLFAGVAPAPAPALAPAGNVDVSAYMAAMRAMTRAKPASL